MGKTLILKSDFALAEKLDRSPIHCTKEELRILDESMTDLLTECQFSTTSKQYFESKITDMLKDDFKAILNELRSKEGDELVDEFERIFRSRIPKDIADLEKARKDLDFTSLKYKAHYLTTTLITLKFNHGLALSSQIEKAVIDNQETAALTLTDQFIDYLNDALNEI